MRGELARACGGPEGLPVCGVRGNKKEQFVKRLLFLCIWQCQRGEVVADVGHQSHITGTLDGNRQLTLMKRRYRSHGGE